MYYLLGFGSNIDPETHFINARNQLAEFADVIAVSPSLRTDTVGSTFHFPFKNQLLLVSSETSAESLKKQLQQIEISLGREPKNPARKEKDRTIDIDILANGSSAEKCLTTKLEDSYNNEVKSLWLAQQPEVFAAVTETSAHND